MDLSCPRCQTTKYRNPKMKLMVSTCGHSLCETCVNFVFVKGVGNCHECHTFLKKNTFRYQIFEDPYIERETDVRKRILKIFNKKETDFPTLDAYNDYLEMIEGYIFNIVNKIDVEETERKMADYKEVYKDIIAKNRGRLSKDEMYIEYLVEQERQTDELRKRVHEQELQEEMEAKKKVKEDLIEALMQSDGNVHRVIESHKTRIQGLEAKREQLQSIQLNLPKNDEVQPLYEYVKPIDDPHGPTLPDSSDLDRLGYLNNVRREKPSERAGGYTSEYPCLRALKEAFDMLLYVKEGIDSSTNDQVKKTASTSVKIEKMETS